MITAEEARRNTESIIEGKNAKFLLEIGTHIEARSKAGYEMVVVTKLPSPVRDELKKLGYTVCDLGDSRDSQCYEISW